MSSAFYLALGFKELRHHGRKLFTVLFILTIGLAGPLFASALRSSVETYLSSRSRMMLSADLAVSAMRPFKASEIQKLEELLQPLRQVAETEFVTMARTERGDGSGDQTSARNEGLLVEVKAEGDGFPIFGEVKLKASGIHRGDDLNREKIAWVYPEVLVQLGLKAGDSLRIGEASFRIADEIEDAPGQGRTAGLAPRIYIGRKFADDTRLTQYGSQVFHRLYVELPPKLSVEMASARIKASLQDPEIFLRTPDDAIQGFERFFRFFGLYLNAIILIVFAFAFTGAYYILQIFLKDRLKNAAVLLLNGASRSRTGFIYVLEVTLLLLIAYGLSALGVELVTYFLPFILNKLGSTPLPDGFNLQVSGRDLIMLGILSVASAIAFTAPFLVSLYSARLQTLLGESSLGVSRSGKRASILSATPTLLIYLAISVWLMNSWKEGLEISSAIAMTGLIGVAIGRFLFRFLFRFVKQKPGSIRLIATVLARSRFGVNLCFLALVLVALVMNLVPHLLKSIVTEVLPAGGKDVPAFFLFNIPESKIDDLKAFAARRSLQLRYLSPLVQGRLLKVNGEPIKSEQLERFPVRLSYRTRRIESETISAGREFSTEAYDPAGDKPAEISVETKFAERNGMKLGDSVEFDIQGAPISTVIVQLRRVQWSGFNPNFFIMFQPGVLEEAPKTWLANIGEKIESDTERSKLQYALVRDFPDLSVIDIGRTITRIFEIARSVIAPLTAAAMSAVILSFLILVAIILHNLKMRDRELDIQKVFGADGSLIRRLITGEYFITALFAWLVGIFASLALASFVVVRIFEIALVISYPAVMLSWFFVVCVTTLIAWFSAGRVLRQRGFS